MTVPQQSTTYDIAIVGGGPVGLTAANLAAVYGLRTLIVEKEPKPFPLPRAIHFNGDVLRIFQMAGLADQLRPQIGDQRGVTIFGADGRPNAILHYDDAASGSGWNTQYSFFQPVFEATLREAARYSNLVDFRSDCDATIGPQDDSGVALALIADGRKSTVSARYVLACDGARSPTRSALGIEMEEIGSYENWVVVDTFLDSSNPLPADRSHIYCDPDRPAVYVPGPGQHRRFEWLVKPGEDLQAMNERKTVRDMIGRWAGPGEAEIIRHATYRFGARVARRWRSDRIFLAGDAAHQTPPFLGQGMGHGVRDVANLIWKIDLVLRSVASNRLLDSYEIERKPQVSTVIGRSIEVGKMVSLRDPVEAAARDRAARAQGPIERLDRNKIMPRLVAGYLGTGAHAGTQVPQAWIVSDGCRKRLDDTIGPRTAIITRGHLDEKIVALLADRPDLHWLDLLSKPNGSAGAWISESQSISCWLDEIDADVLIVRPDRHVFDHGSAVAAERLISNYIEQREQ